MSGQRRGGQGQPLTSKNNIRGGNRQGGARAGTHIPVPSSNKAETGKRGSAQRNGKQKQTQSQQNSSSNTEAAENNPAQVTGAQNARQGQSPVQQSRPLPTPPLEDRKKKALQVANRNRALKNGSSECVQTELDSIDNEEKDIPKELQTLAQELGITDGSPQEIIKTACREIRKSKETISKDEMKRKVKELEELKKDLFSVNRVNGKEHDIENAKAKIQDLHRCQEDVTLIKTAAMNPNKSKGFKLTQSAKEVEERIHTLNGYQKDLTVIKTAVMNPNKSKDFKVTHSTEEVVERIHNLHGIEHECLQLKEIIFNKELQNLASLQKLEESQHTVENANKIAAELTRVFEKMETGQRMLCKEVLGENEQPSVEELLKAVQSLKKAAEENKNDIQQKKSELEKMETEIAHLKKQLTHTENEHQTLLKTYQEREQKLQKELKEVKSQKENALTRLSEVAGAKLTESNPYITDLSDPNRPEKIGEQFSELYDNLWTDVFEKLSGTCKLSERDSIQTLLQILEDSYGYCKDISSKRYSNTLAELTLWKLVEPNETPSQVPKKKGKNISEKKKDADTKETTVNVTLEELQKLQTLLGSPSPSSPADSRAVDSILAKIGLNVTSLSNIKKMLKSSLEGTSVIVQENFWKQRSGDPKGNKEILECTKPFLMKCVNICWLMVGQDPPVYLRFSDKCQDKFNKDVYREYTANGKVLDFVVWPAIFLHENGPLLKKGVAQPIAKK